MTEPEECAVRTDVPKPRGRTRWERPATPYELFVEGEKVPVYRAVDGIRDVRELQLGAWDRLGCDGAFVQLRGLGGLQGMYILSIPPHGRVAAERHTYEEIFYVVEGEGATRVWTDDSPDGADFSWTGGAVFTVPLNAWHELANEQNTPALVMVATNAPPVMRTYRDRAFVFDNPWAFAERRAEGLERYVSPQGELGTDPLSHRAHYTAAVFPDAGSRELPYDGQRGEDYRHIELDLGGNVYTGFIGEYPGRSYGHTHTHRSGPMLFCMKGEGYTLTWPDSLGTRPWESGHGDQVRRIDYRQGGVMSPVPGGESWFHGHYNSLDTPLRMLAHLGAYPRLIPGDPGDAFIDTNALISDGGGTIARADEDPMLEAIFKGTHA